MKTRAVARKYTVSESWVRGLKRRRAATGEVAPRSPKNRRGSPLPPKATGQAKAQLRKREIDSKADLKWPGGRAGSR